ncbi:MAG: ATP-dependent Clp protease proteolytic subunit [Patescibacteria group bacterium]
MRDRDRWEEWKNKFWEGLLERRHIYLGGEIDDGTANQIGKIILWLNSQGGEEIKLFINSDGGSVSAGLDIYDIIKYSKAPVNGIVYRRANSMATVVLRACVKRTAMSHSLFSFHNTVLSLMTEWDEFEDKSKNRLKEIKDLQEEIYKILTIRSTTEAERIKEICKRKLTLSASQMKALGLIDEII